MRHILVVLLFVASSSLHAQSPSRVSGYVLEAGTDEPLPGATVAFAFRTGGVATNAYGYFSLSTAAPDTSSLVVRYLGHEPARLTLEELRARARGPEALARLRLAKRTLAGSEAVVRAERPRRPAAGAPAVSIEEAERLPALLGEVDPVRVQQLLPGVRGGVEGGAGLHVRGGSPDQTLLLLDGATVYNASHLFGFFSTFNPAAVKSVELIRGGVPARYGGRLASVLDVQTREGGGGRTTGEASVGLASAHLRLEGPLTRTDSASRRPQPAYALALRQTYAGLLARPFQPSGERADYGFSDLNLKLSASPGSRGRVYLSGYLGRDAFDTFARGQTAEDRGRLAWGNATGTLRWAQPLGTRTFLQTALVATRYGVVIRSESNDLRPGGGASSSSYASSLSDLGALVHLETDRSSSPISALRTGGSITRHAYQPGRSETQSRDAAAFVSRSPSLAAWEGVVYAEADLRPAPALVVAVGVRGSLWHADGDAYPTTSYGAGEPRLAARLEVAPGAALTASLAASTQYVHLLTNSGLGVPTDLWLPSTARVRPQRGVSTTLGAELVLPYATTLSVEGYGRSMTGLVDYQNGAGLFNTAAGDWEGQVTQTRGRAYGAEVLLKRSTGATTGWLAYTLSRSERLADGAWYPYRYDRTHDAALVLSHRTRGGSDLAATWVYGTGDALTLPLSRGPAFDVTPGAGYDEDDYEDEIELYSDRGANRAPAMHRLDLSVTFNRRVGRTERALTLGLYNVYNRANPLYVALRREYEFVQVAGPDGQPSFARIPRGARLYRFGFLPTLPAVSYRVRF